MVGKAAALGNEDFVMPFMALGLVSFPVTNDTEQILSSARKIIDEKFSLVVVAEDIAGVVQDEFDQTGSLPLPCIIVVPFTKEPKGFATASLGKALKMATGIDIINS